MDFLDNVMKSSNALLKERMNNPFKSKTQVTKQDGDQQQQQPIAADQTTESNLNADDQPALEGSSGSTTTTVPTTAELETQPLAAAASSDGENGRNISDKNSQFAAIAADAEAVTQKAVKGAKNIGTFLFSMANKAGQTVTQTAKQVKQAVESTSILTEFTREQQDFIKEHGGSMQAGELPWLDCGTTDEAKLADIREQILTLSQDKRNFVRGPPSDSSFQFDPQQSYPVALSLLKEDPNLSKMRFELVPKLVSEDTFWCNYFYRVFLLKQMSDRGEDIKRQGWVSSRSSSGEGPDEITTADEVNQNEDPSSSYSAAATSRVTSSQQAQQSVNVDNISSKSTNLELESNVSTKPEVDADDLKSKLKELDIGSFDDGCGQDENEKWEEELQRDLQEFELVSGDVSALDEEALDKDIMELKQAKDIK